VREKEQQMSESGRADGGGLRWKSNPSLPFQFPPSLYNPLGTLANLERRQKGTKNKNRKAEMLAGANSVNTR
jgi:hypothetical protein